MFTRIALIILLFQNNSLCGEREADNIRQYRKMYAVNLTPATPAGPNYSCSKGLALYRSNPPFLIFDIRAL